MTDTKNSSAKAKWSKFTSNPKAYLGKEARFQRTRKFLAKHLPETLFWDEFYMKYTYWRFFGKKLDLKNPQTFNEKLRWIMLYDRNPLYTLIADKILVREYVEERIGAKHLKNLIGVYENPSDININILPEKFVLKMNHGSHMNIICENKGGFCLTSKRIMINKWKHYNFYNSHREWHYKHILPKILIEELITDYSTLGLIEYNHYCFNGQPVYIEANMVSNSKNYRIYFDTSWREQAFSIRHPEPSTGIPKPENLKVMVDVAKKLAHGLTFCRVDLFNISGKIIFGEITLTPGAGYLKFVPRDYDLEWGNLIKLNINN